MLHYVYGQDDIVAPFVAQFLPYIDPRGFPRPMKTVGIVEDDGRLIAGLVYTNWNYKAGTIEISGAALPKHNWLTRETIFRMYGFPFLECDAQMVIKKVSADNEHLLAQLARGGFMFVQVPRLYGRGHDGVMCLLTREEWDRHPLYRRKQSDELKEAA